MDMLLAFWGKTVSDPSAAVGAYHPALYHMLDVACVAEALLGDEVNRRFSQVLAKSWRGVDRDQLFAWLPFLVATHDLGKISAPFQGQVAEQCERLAQVGIAVPPRYDRAPFHAEVSAVWLHQHLMRHEPNVAWDLAVVLRDAMGGHHGRFLQDSMKDLGQRLRRSEKGVAPEWEQWRDGAYTLLREVLHPPGALADLGAPTAVRPATAILTGFLIVCDWVGSNANYFPASPHVPLDAYVALARTRAREGIRLSGLVPERVRPTYVSFADLFPTMPPRPLQAMVDEIPDDVLARPLLAIIEAPTGEGKTEAALALARRLGALDAMDELFFALPTMATSNQMYGRLTRFYDALYGVAVRLTHSQAMVMEAELHQAALAGDGDVAEPQATSRFAAIEWFTGPKKAMLAPFGVGTVDQVELAGLHVRHYVLRLFALAGKVVIVDEVHAYDAYMSTILEHTLTWLASLGTSVLLLSATLPAARHQALAASYVRGLGRPAPDVPATLPYPSVALYHAGTPYRVTPGVFRPEQTFRLQWTRCRAPEEDARYLFELVRDGGAVARIVNLVDDAQQIYLALRQWLPAEQCVLLHARMPLQQREACERRIQELVGKETQRAADEPLVIVGTQVLEQSLDYDVDVMVSDCAPVDLLLQRAGRLHRHVGERAGKRPARHAQPVLQVVLPLDANDVPDWGSWAYIYVPYVLWRTWEEVCDATAAGERDVVLPQDYRRLIEAVYGDATCHTRTGDAAYAKAKQEAWTALQQAQSNERVLAQKHLTPRVTDAGFLTEVSRAEFVEDEHGALDGWSVAKTRLGDRVTVVPLYRVGHAFSFDAMGTDVLSRDVPPWRASELQDVIKHSLPISTPAIIEELRAGKRPECQWPWGDVPPVLRSLFPLVLSAEGTAEFERHRVRLDRELGLVIEKKK